MSIALSLTLARLFFSPLFLVVYLYYQRLSIPLTVLPYLLILMLTFAELTDLFDGIMARKRNQVTELGKLLDPMADSVFRLTVFLTFTKGMVQLPLLLVVVFLYRDSIISTLRTVCALRGVALAARLSGKVKAVIQGCAAYLILLLMIPYSRGLITLNFYQNVSFWVIVVTAIYTVGSGVEYVVANREYIQKALKRK